MEDAPDHRHRAVRQLRSRHATDLVERCRSSSGHHIPGPPRSSQRNALLAPGCARGESQSRRSLRRHLRGHKPIAFRLSEVESAGAARTRTGQPAPSAVVSSRGAAGRIDVLLLADRSKPGGRRSQRPPMRLRRRAEHKNGNAGHMLMRQRPPYPSNQDTVIGATCSIHSTFL